MSLWVLVGRVMYYRGVGQKGLTLMRFHIMKNKSKFMSQVLTVFIFYWEKKTVKSSSTRSSFMRIWQMSYKHFPLFWSFQTFDFVVQKLYALRKPKTNIQILQQSVLLKYKWVVSNNFIVMTLVNLFYHIGIFH